jgi:hypothetical protein
VATTGADVSLDLAGHNAYPTPIAESTVAPPIANHTIGANPDDPVATGAGAAIDVGTVSAGPLIGSSNAKSAGETLLTVDDTDNIGPAATPIAAAGATSLASLLHPAGAAICTMLPHFGQAWISPIAAALRTLSRDRHVSQITRKASTELVAEFARIQFAGL